jgi:adenosylcobinamide kinase/adenosylcobinamide-phosphate guanylyltransferase
VLILIGGGVRCGKSAFALSRARSLGTRRVYVATAEALDGEMSERIQRHVRERGSEFRTVEAPLDVVEKVDGIVDADVVVIDCLTLWLTNLLLRGDLEAAILAQVDRLVSTLRGKPYPAIVVTNEVGMGVVPDSSLGRVFRDLCGRAHQTIARSADEIYFGALGTLIRLRPEPLAVLTPTETNR